MTRTETTVEILELREAGEDGGDLMGYYCKGHVDRWVFAQASNHYSGAFESYDIRHVRPEKVRHVWWRCVPIAGETGTMEFQPAEPHSNGAWAATVCESVIDHKHASSRQSIRDWHRARSQGISEGVNWCLRTLERSNPTESERLLKEFREQRDEIEGKPDQ